MAFYVNDIRTPLNVAKYDYAFMESNASQYYEFTIKSKIIGDYVIEPTAITFLNQTGTTEYTARSTHISLHVYITPPPSNEKTLWGNLFLLEGIILLIPLVILFIKKLLWRN